MDIDTNHPAEVRAEKKSGKAGKIVACVLLSGCLVASLGLNIYQAAVTNQKSGEFIDYIYDRIAEEEKKENEYIEDGFKVGGEYEIRSTTHISDAYKGGDDSQLSEEDKDTLNMAKKVLDEIIEDGMSDYEKEEAVYQWMVKNIGGSSRGVISRPGMDRSAFTPHDVLTSKNAVCVGYATTFRLFMNMLGMDCHIVHNEYHSWDLVQLDGDWYHVDIYSDVHGVMYGNFNMTDEVCESGHNWDQSALPEASSVKYSPAVQNAMPVEDIYGVPATLKSAMDEREQNKDSANSVFFFSFTTPLTEDGMSAAEYLANYLELVMDGMLEDSYYFGAQWYPSEKEDEYILGLLMENRNTDEEAGLDSDSPEVQKIIQAIAEAFELDPAMLGGDPEGGDYPDDSIAAPETVGSQTVVTENGEIVATWEGGGSVAIP